MIVGVDWAPSHLQEGACRQDLLPSCLVGLGLGLGLGSGFVLGFGFGLGVGLAPPVMPGGPPPIPPGGDMPPGGGLFMPGGPPARGTELVRARVGVWVRVER